MVLLDIMDTDGMYLVMTLIATIFCLSLAIKYQNERHEDTPPRVTRTPPSQAARHHHPHHDVHTATPTASSLSITLSPTIRPFETMSGAQRQLHKALPFSALHHRRTITLTLPSCHFLTEVGVRERLGDFLQLGDFYLVIVVATEDEEQAYMAALEASQLISQDPHKTTIRDNTTTTTTLPRHKVLFASTAIGKHAILRQLHPTVHIEFERSTVLELDRFKQIERMIYLSRTEALLTTDQLSSRIQQGRTFTSFFEALAASPSSSPSTMITPAEE